MGNEHIFLIDLIEYAQNLNYERVEREKSVRAFRAEAV